MKTTLKKITATLCLLTTFMFGTAPSSSASEAYEPPSLKAVSYDLSVLGGNSSLAMLNKKIDFNIQTLGYYADDSSAFDKFVEESNVKTEYNFFNPQSSAVSSTLFFSLNTKENHVTVGEISEGAFLEDVYNGYSVTVNGEEPDIVTRYTVLDEFRGDTYADYGFFKPDMPVHHYSYTVNSIDGADGAATLTFNVEVTHEETYLLYDNTAHSDANVAGISGEPSLAFNVKEGETVDLYFIGEAPSCDPEWTLTNTAGEAVEGDITEEDPQLGCKNLKDAVKKVLSFVSGVTDFDLYNIFVDYTTYYTTYSLYTNLGVFSLNGIESLELYLWCQYDVTLEPEEMLTTAVTSPIRSSTITHEFMQTEYQYEFHISSDTSYIEAGPTDIRINTPHFLENSTTALTAIEGGYVGHLEDDDSRNLTFSLTKISDEEYNENFSIFVGVILIFLMVGQAILKILTLPLDLINGILEFFG